MANKNKNNEKSTFIKAITNFEGIFSYIILLWIFSIPVLFFIAKNKSYKAKVKETKIIELQDSISDLNKTIYSYKDKNIVLNNQLANTNYELQNLNKQVVELRTKLQQTTNQYTNYKTNINDQLNDMKTDLWRLNTQISSVQQKIQGRPANQGRSN